MNEALKFDITDPAAYDLESQLHQEQLNGALKQSLEFDVLGELAFDPNDEASVARNQRAMEVIAAESLREVDFSFDSLKAELERRKAMEAHAVAEQRKMDLFVIDNYVDKEQKPDEEETSNVTFVDFSKKSNKKTKAA